MRTAIAILILPLLAACQSQNPYRAESLPMPPAPPQAATTFSRSRRLLRPLLDAYILCPMGDDRSHKYLPFDIAP